MKPNLALSLFIGALFSTFITAIYDLMSTVPVLMGQAKEDPNLLGNLILCWLFVTAICSYGMHQWQKALEELNKPRSSDDADRHEKRTDEQR